MKTVIEQIIEAGAKGWQELHAKGCTIYLEPRPEYCDRGNFLAKVDGVELDGCDGWPRYYFSEAAAKSEIEAWLKKREIFIEGQGWTTHHL